VGSTAGYTACLNPVPGTIAGEAVMSPACRAYLTSERDALRAGGRVVNNTTTGPVVDGNRPLAYTWSYSFGVKRELANNLAASIDYVGNEGRANTAIIDINEGPTNPATGRITRLGVNVFDPSGELVTGAARNATFVQFNQYRSSEALNTDFKSLELDLEKRFSKRWSGRASYTWAKCHDVGSIIVDSDPRLDYGRCDRDNRHAFSGSTNLDLGKGFGTGFVFRTYSGYPINETTGTDSNGDGTTPNNDRPTKGLNDLVTLPSGKPGAIVSAVDSRGVAVRNGIDGERKTILDGRFQYTRRISRYQAGLFLEVYNLLNHTNFGNATGARNNANFLNPIIVDTPRTAQLGFRLLF
jgi:hypothetical protein